MSVRSGHKWYCGPPGSYTDDQLKKIAGRWFACPGCTIDAFNEGKCHTGPIIKEFQTKFPELEAPKFVSVCTKTVEGKGGLRDVLVTKDAIFAGCKPPRAAPTAKELGVSLPASIFGNPEVQKRLDEGKDRARETKARKKREATHGLGSVEYGTTEIRDLPVRTLAEAEEEWRAFFEKAWAQKREREAAEARGETYVPAWQKKQKQAAKSATDALMQAARAKAEKEKAQGQERAAKVTSALSRRHDSDSDSDSA